MKCLSCFYYGGTQMMAALGQLSGDQICKINHVPNVLYPKPFHSFLRFIFLYIGFYLELKGQCFYRKIKYNLITSIDKTLVNGPIVQPLILLLHV